MYTILISDLVITATHGLLPEEKITPQEFLVNTKVVCTFPEDLAKQDLFDDTFCYGIMREKIIAIFTEQSYDTIEALAYKINNDLLACNPHATSITTRIEKTKLLKDCRVGIELTTSR